MTGKLADKVAVVIGGSSGIGLGIAKRFAQEGAQCLLPVAADPNWMRQSP
jgi:NAD(P)-dependent dehydrogenase (short-subunit alcohol dehydrogenase family)